MAVHVLDAICKLLEDMPCLRHFRRCTVLAKWPRGHVATLPSALKTPGWRKLKSIQSIKLYCLMLQNYILEIYIDLLHIVIWGYLFDLVWSCLILFDLGCVILICFVFQSRLYTSLWSASLSLSLHFSLFETACSRSPPRRMGAHGAQNLQRSGWERMIGWSETEAVCRCLQFDQISLIVFMLVLIVQYWN
jgi:hypothetical protein